MCVLPRDMEHTIAHRWLALFGVHNHCPASGSSEAVIRRRSGHVNGIQPHGAHTPVMTLVPSVPVSKARIESRERSDVCPRRRPDRPSQISDNKASYSRERFSAFGVSIEPILSAASRSDSSTKCA